MDTNNDIDFLLKQSRVPDTIPNDRLEQAKLLHHAVYHRDVVLTKYFLDCGFDPNVYMLMTAKRRYFSLLISGTLLHHYTEMRTLLCALTFSSRVVPTYRPPRTVLHVFAAGSGIAAVDKLLAAGADPEAQDTDGDTPLMYCNTAAVAQRLLSAGASPTRRNAFGYDALDHAYVRANEEVCRLLSIDGYAPQPMALLARAIRENNSPKVELLLASGISAYTVGCDGNLPLHQAARQQSAALVELFLIKGIDIDSRNRHGDTPLHECLAGSSVVGKDFQGHSVTLNLLLRPRREHGCGDWTWYSADFLGTRMVVSSIYLSALTRIRLQFAESPRRDRTNVGSAVWNDGACPASS